MDAMADLECVHYVGVDAMDVLVMGHLAGGAVVMRKVDGATTAGKK